MRLMIARVVMIVIGWLVGLTMGLTALSDISRLYRDNEKLNFIRNVYCE